MEYTGNVCRQKSHSSSETSSDVSSDSSTPPFPVVITTNKKRKNDNVNKIVQYDDDNSDNTFITDEEDDFNDDTNDDGLVSETNDVTKDRTDFWTKLRVITKSQSDTILLPLWLPKNKLSPPTTRDRVRVSRQKKNSLEKELAKTKNNQRFREFYNKLSPTEKKNNKRGRKDIGLSEMLSILVIVPIVPRRHLILLSLIKQKRTRVLPINDYH